MIIIQKCYILLPGFSRLLLLYVVHSNEFFQLGKANCEGISPLPIEPPEIQGPPLAPHLTKEYFGIEEVNQVVNDYCNLNFINFDFTSIPDIRSLTFADLITCLEYGLIVSNYCFLGQGPDVEAVLVSPNQVFQSDGYKTLYDQLDFFRDRVRERLFPDDPFDYTNFHKLDDYLAHITHSVMLCENLMTGCLRDPELSALFHGDFERFQINFKNLGLYLLDFRWDNLTNHPGQGNWFNEVLIHTSHISVPSQHYNDLADDEVERLRCTLNRLGNTTGVALLNE